MFLVTMPMAVAPLFEIEQGGIIEHRRTKMNSYKSVFGHNIKVLSAAVAFNFKKGMNKK